MQLASVNSAPIHKLTHCSIASQGSDVVLNIGGTVMTWNYKDALKIADLIRFRAIEAKRFAKDTSTTYHILANLTDAAADLDLHANIREI